MTEKHFNLVDESWIEVIDFQGQRQTVSLQTALMSAHQYRQLGGETQSQDLAILRLLLAVLHTVYSRFDAEGTAYDWLEVDERMQVASVSDSDEFDSDDLYETWRQLKQQKEFTSVVADYLQVHHNQFDFFGEAPFYQVAQDVYDHVVPAKKQVATGTGTVAIKQINRQISESGNTPAIFAPKTGRAKNQLSLAELVRWIVAYQNYTGVTDKTKIETDEKFSTNAGWLYRLNSVYVSGHSLFETLLLNLVLVNPGDDELYAIQQPVWEFDEITSYIEQRKLTVQPDNIAAIYTTWSRLLHIQWEDDIPTIFSAGLPMFPAENLFTEPMTTWRIDKKTKDYLPATKQRRRLDEAMWRHFGQYVLINKDDNVHEPGIVSWIHQLKNKQLLDSTRLLRLMSVSLISDGNATSQSPIAEVSDELAIDAEVLFDDATMEHWPVRIEEAIKFTQKIGDTYYYLAKDIANIRDYQGSEFAERAVGKFYAELNGPFKRWLADLRGDDNRDEKLLIWRRQLKQITRQCVDQFTATISPIDIRGLPADNGKGDSVLNIFTALNRFWRRVNQLMKEG